MDTNNAGTQARLCVHIIEPATEIPSIEQDVRDGLLSRPRSLPPKYFYDERGSQLFDRICDTPEYYPTRTENALLLRFSSDIIQQVMPDQILELGSGTSRKTRHLFDACDAHDCQGDYAPFDVCEEMLRSTGKSLIKDYEWMNVTAMVGDYHGGLSNLPLPQGRRLFLFLGGTIGNFSHQQAQEFLAEVRDCMQPDDWLLLGADRVKSSALLHAAYNDSSGVTAEFNRNVLRVLNQSLDADFEPEAFSHQAEFNEQESRIEMYLVAKGDQQVRVDALDEEMTIRDGERILTEISRKFTRNSLEQMLIDAGFQVQEHFEPDNGYFSLLLVQPGDNHSPAS